ncbi:MAG TPA: hypothetical protein VIV11_04090 [Kofleriaceae bacterium]
MRLVIAGTLMVSAGLAHADHAHSVDNGGKHAFGAGVAMVAASYDSMLYVGNYQGIAAAVTWSNDRFAAGASTAWYRIEANGRSLYGFGDVVAHGQVRLVGDRHAGAGVMAAASAPTGDDRHGLGMGHPMLMPALFGTWHVDRVRLAATAGYSVALGGNDGHDHGMWPIVEPMNRSELTWSAGGDVAITPRIHGGVRLSGGVPIGDGDHRLAGGVRAGWTSGRFITAAELQAGLAGDPFNIRGVVSGSVSF